ncbi:hypothetical protein MSG28_000217 [Choristoneura fumiferana]|uniref:Uncharacterized protein n=1 Tax=Choristoneura fumiferana TaxID=7141 RepID=A0ACC0K016_CHOFU|nr:hypothetical protein MSG28_000217 [Choristoneura fumiferana]
MLMVGVSKKFRRRSCDVPGVLAGAAKLGLEEHDARAHTQRLHTMTSTMARECGRENVKAPARRPRKRLRTAPNYTKS